MNARLRTAWGSRSPLERTIIAVLAGLTGVVLYAVFSLAAVRNRAQLSASVGTLRAQAMRMDAQAIEFGRLRGAPAVTASPTDLRTLLQARAGEAGLAPALVSVEAADANQARVIFGAVPFADWLAWAATLQAQQVRIEQCRIEALSTPGLVSVNATFTRAQP